MASVQENKKNSSSWFDIEAVPEAYTFPQELRPCRFHNKSTFSLIDLSKIDCCSKQKEESIKQILKACQEVGVFQVINHGFSEELIKETVSVMKDFFSLGAEEKVHPVDGGWVYMSSTDFANNGAYLWRENVKLPCHPLQDTMQRWPQKPSRYREVVAAYLLAIRKLSSRILELMCEGLGLEAEHLKDVGEVQLLSSNNYPPCPDPRLTMGLLQHRDPSLITLLYQGNTTGLQVLQDEEWITVETVPNAFVVNIGNQLEIISNGKLKSPMHRVVTNAESSRLSIATFTNPSPSYIVKPAAALITDESKASFEPTTYADYINGSKLYGEEAFGPGTKSLFQSGSR